MAGGLVKYRHLGRNSSARQALLRNLVTSLIKHETIQTTWHKAKEAQRLAEKLITYAKRDNEECRRKAQAILYTPDLLLPKLFGTLKTRYAARQGGYTRVLRTEPKDTYDQAASAILELVDGPRDMRFAMTAAAVARDRALGKAHTDITRRSIDKVTRFRPGGEREFEDMVARTAELRLDQEGLQLDQLSSTITEREERFRPRKEKPRHDFWGGMDMLKELEPSDLEPSEPVAKTREMLAEEKRGRQVGELLKARSRISLDEVDEKKGNLTILNKEQ